MKLFHPATVAAFMTLMVSLGSVSEATTLTPPPPPNTN